MRATRQLAQEAGIYLHVRKFEIINQVKTQQRSDDLYVLTQLFRGRSAPSPSTQD